MKTWYLIVLGLLAAHLSYAQKSDIGELDFIINVNGVTELPQSEILKIFKNGKSLWNNNQKVIIVLPAKNSSLASDVAKNLYNTSVSGMQKFWLALVFQGRSSPPVFLQSAQDIVEYVENNPGAIAAIPAGSIEIPSNLKLSIK
jgi:ABC-type phosphate transport system substrate-binding protein